MGNTKKTDAKDAKISVVSRNSTNVNMGDFSDFIN